jgi:GTP-binding protein HflX
VAAFRSTLTETRDADLLLHVVDAASEERQANIEQVNNVLREIGAEDRPQLMVYNKIDLLENPEARIENDDEDLPAKVWVSALTGEGLDLLSQAIEIRLYGETVAQQLCLPPSEGRLNAKLHELGAVREEHYDEQGNSLVNVLLQRRDWNALCKNEQLEKFIVEDSGALRLAVGHEGP